MFNKIALAAIQGDPKKSSANIQELFCEKIMKGVFNDFNSLFLWHLSGNTKFKLISKISLTSNFASTFKLGIITCIPSLRIFFLSMTYRQKCILMTALTRYQHFSKIQDAKFLSYLSFIFVIMIHTMILFFNNPTYWILSIFCTTK